jgi:hypothetical protein
VTKGERWPADWQEKHSADKWKVPSTGAPTEYLPGRQERFPFSFLVAASFRDHKTGVSRDETILRKALRTVTRSGSHLPVRSGFAILRQSASTSPHEPESRWRTTCDSSEDVPLKAEYEPASFASPLSSDGKLEHYRKANAYGAWLASAPEAWASSRALSTDWELLSRTSDLPVTWPDLSEA